MKTITILNRAHVLSREWAIQASEEAGFPIHPGSYRLLLTLASYKKPMSISDIATDLELTIQSAGKTLHDMLSKGIVTVEPDEVDRRVKLYSLSLFGLRLL